MNKVYRDCRQHSPRDLIVTWLILWVVFLPLVHTHLADFAEEIAATVIHRSGFAHTIFSPDLPDEFRPPNTNGGHRQAVLRAATIVSECEIGLSMLEPDDRKHPKANGGIWFNVTPPRLRFVTLALRNLGWGEVIPTPSRLFNCLETRGPPVGPH